LHMYWLGVVLVFLCLPCTKLDLYC